MTSFARTAADSAVSVDSAGGYKPPVVIVTGVPQGLGPTPVGMFGSSNGTLWHVIPSPADNTAFPPNPVVFGVSFDSTARWIIGYGTDTHGHVLATSPDGGTWTARTTPFDGLTSGGGAAFPGAWSSTLGLWVIPGYQDVGNAVIITSPDGITWTARTTPFDGGTVNSVTWGNGLFVACGEDSTSSQVIMTSTDGTTWTAQTTPWDGSGAGGFASSAWWDGVNWIAAGQDSAHAHSILTSPDAITWTARATPFDAGGGGGAFNPASQWVVGNTAGTLVAVGTPKTAPGPVLCTSTDHGVTWTARTTPWDATVAHNDGQASTVTYAPTLSLWVATGTSPSLTATVLATSTDAITWTAQTTPWDGPTVPFTAPAFYSSSRSTTPTSAPTVSVTAKAAFASAGFAQSAITTIGLGPPGQPSVPLGGGLDVSMRITAWDLTVADVGLSKLSFTLAIPPPGRSPTPPKLWLPQLLAQLQAQQSSLTTVTTGIVLPPIIDGGGGGGGGGSGTPSGSVVGPVPFGQPSSPGSSADFSPGDHDHGLPDISIPYTFSGGLYPSESPPVTPHQNMTITGFSATLGVSGTSDTVVELVVNAVTAASITLASGITYGNVTGLSVSLASRSDHYAVAVTTAGTGAVALGGEIEANSGP